MAYTEEDRAALKAAIAKGARRLRIGNEEVEYRSLDEMRAALRMIEAELSGAPGASICVSYPRTTRGL